MEIQQSGFVINYNLTNFFIFKLKGIISKSINIRTLIYF
ncbi:MAG: hypothetical protein BAJALOKI3v1_620025 [Promethearchaeota archaeon]|nr:MAG: hypothetical protein BAJALOKI3v1_620025 [Candidatus Lokiarchaeota archaeon]